MTTTLYLVRHGEADESTTDDPGLTARGQEQARRVANRLAGIDFTEVLHSGRQRAEETASIVAATLGTSPPSVSDDAADRTPFPSDWAVVRDTHRSFFESIPIGERDVDGVALDRAIARLSRVGSDDRRSLVVTHNFVIGWFVRDALGAAPMRWTDLHSDNGALTIIAYAAGRPPRLIAFNDTGHLRDR